MLDKQLINITNRVWDSLKTEPTKFKFFGLPLASKLIVIFLVFFGFRQLVYGQNDNLETLFHQNITFSHSVVRFENTAIVSLLYDYGELNQQPNFYIKSAMGQIILPKKTTNEWKEVLFENLALDEDYTIHSLFGGLDIPIQDLNTDDFILEPFETSDKLFSWLELWYDIPKEERTDVTDFILQLSDVSFFERISFIQAFLDIPTLPNTLLEQSEGANIFEIWVDYGDPLDHPQTHSPGHLANIEHSSGEIMDFRPLDPANLDKCICQYILRSRGGHDPTTRFDNKDYFYNLVNFPKQHHNLRSTWPRRNSETFTHIKKGFVGPAKFVEFRLEGYKSWKTIHGNDGGLTSTPSSSVNNHFAGIKMRLLCDGLPQEILNRIHHFIGPYPEGEKPDLSFLIPTPAEECLCSKKVDLCFRYDSDIFVETTDGGGNSNNEATITVQDYVTVELEQGASDKQTLKTATQIAKAKCNANHLDAILKSVDILADNTKILAIQAKILNETDAVKLAELNAELVAGQAALLATISESEDVVNDCSSDNFTIGINGCKQITLKSNETTKFTMSSDYKINAEGKESFKAKANIKSDFYLTAIMQQPNITTNDVKYCCSKKWGRYLLASYSGAPLTRQQVKNEVGNIFAFSKNWDAPYQSLATSTTPTVIYDRDVLTGGVHCDDLIFDNSSPKMEKVKVHFENSPLSNVDVLFNSPTSIRIVAPQGSNTNSTYTVMVTDIMGRVLVNKNYSDLPDSITNVTFQKGAYFVTLTSGRSYITFKIWNNE